MKWPTFANTWHGLRAENVMYRITTPVLSLCLVVALTGWLTKDRVTVLVPPNLVEATSVSKRSADGAYKKAWGMFTASLLGNITPGNADFVLESLQVLMTPSVYSALQSSIAKDIASIKKDGVGISFEGKQIIYERDTDTVFVLGRTGISTAAGSVTKFDRCFQMKVSIDNGQPQITELDSYEGRPHTVEWTAMANAAKAEKAAAARK